MGKAYEKTLSTTVQTVASISLDPGLYLLFGYSQINVSAPNALCDIAIKNYENRTTVRFSGDAGGGAFTFMLLDATEDITMELCMYYGGTVTAKNRYTRFYAIKLQN